MDLLVGMRVFNRVARLRSFSGAARDLGMSKTAVSRHVSNIESSLGVRLLNRTTRRISLTEAGEAYAVRSAAILAEIEEFQRATQNLHRNPGGTLRITAPVTFGHHKISPLIPRFLAKYPDISLQMNLTNRFIDIVEEGYDLGIRIAELPESSLISRKLLSSRVYACAAPQYLQRWGRPSTPADLGSHCCIVFLTARSGSFWKFSNSERDFTISVSGRFQVNSGEAAAHAVRDGVGIGLLPDFLIDKDLASGRVLHLLSDYDTDDNQAYAVYPHKHHLSAKVRVFVDYLSDSLQSKQTTRKRS